MLSANCQLTNFVCIRLFGGFRSSSTAARPHRRHSQPSETHHTTAVPPGDAALLLLAKPAFAALPSIPARPPSSHQPPRKPQCSAARRRRRAGAMGAGAGGTSVAADYVAGAVAGSANIIVGFPGMYRASLCVCVTLRSVARSLEPAQRLMHAPTAPRRFAVQPAPPPPLPLASPPMQPTQ